MLPRLKFGPRYERALCLSTLALSGLSTACYSHAQNPGQVTVTDYGDGEILEVELSEIMLERAEQAHWFEFEVQEHSGVCTPVRIRVSGEDGAPVALDALVIRSLSGTAAAQESEGAWMMEPSSLRSAIYGDPVYVELSGEAVRVHDEQVFNFRQFVEQVTCTN